MESPEQGISRCLEPELCGPWKVLKLIVNTNCQLFRGDANFSPVVHVNQLPDIPECFTHCHTLPAHEQTLHQDRSRKTRSIFNNATSNKK